MSKAKKDFPIYINREFIEIKEGEDVSQKVKCPILLQQLIDSGRVSGKASSNEVKVEAPVEKDPEVEKESDEAPVEEIKVVDVEENKVQPAPKKRGRKPASKTSK